ncbi:MAG: phosphatase PAP2 family protein [archaeon]
MKKKESKGNWFLILLAVIVLVVFFAFYNVIDLYVNSGVPSIRTNFFTDLMIAFSFIGEWYVLGVLTAIVCVILIFNKDNKSAFFIAASMIIGLILELLFKDIIHRARPLGALVLENSFSFPSAHAAMTTIFFLCSYFILKKNFGNRLSLKIFCIAMPMIIGFSRIYLGVHWVSDVIAGFVLGVAVPLVVKRFF